MDIRLILKSLPALLHGMVLTLNITSVSVLCGLLLAVILALMRVSKNPFFWMPSYGFIFYFRGTPLLVQLFLIYYGSGQFRNMLSTVGLWTFFRQAYFCGVLTLTLNTAAYTAEILRGAILAVPFGEIEAGMACGMSKVLLYRRIILPKAFRLGWQAYTNEVVFLLQATSLVSLITLLDITGVARVIAARTFAFYELFLTAAALYLCLVYGLLFLFRKIEQRLLSHLEPIRT